MVLPVTLSYVNPSNTIYASSAGCIPDCIVGTGAKIGGGGTPTDNAAALNAILAQATASHPIDLVLDGGYAIGKSLLIPATGNVTIRGLGWGTGLFILAGSNTNAISSAVFGTTNASYYAVWGIGTPYPLAGPNSIFGQTGRNVVIRDLMINCNAGTYPDGNCNGNRDNTISGNTSPAANVYSPYPDLYWLNGIALAQIDGVLIENVYIYDPPSYHINLHACINVTVRGGRCEAPGRRGSTDGVHVNGGCSNVLVDGTHMGTGDDAVALNIEEGNQVAGAAFKVTNLYLDNCRSAVRVYGSTTTQTYQVSISNINGIVTGNWAVLLAGSGFSPTVSGLNHSVAISNIEVQMTGAAATPFSYVGVVAFAGLLSLDNLRAVDPLFAIPMVYMYQDAPQATVSHLVIHNCHVLRTQAGNAAAFFLLAPVGKIDNLILSDSTIKSEAGQTFADVNYGVDIEGGTVNNIEISNVVCDGVLNAILHTTSGGTTNITVNGLYHACRNSTSFGSLYLFLNTFNVCINGWFPVAGTVSSAVYKGVGTATISYVGGNLLNDGTVAKAPQVDFGEAALGSTFTVASTTAWQDVGLSVTTVLGGSFQFEAHAVVSVTMGSGPIGLAAVRLYNVTAGAPIANTVQLVSDTSAVSTNASVSPVAILTNVAPGTTVKLQASTINNPASAAVNADANSSTVLVYRKLS